MSIRISILFAVSLGIVVCSACQTAKTAQAPMPVVRTVLPEPAGGETDSMLKYAGLIEPYRQVTVAFRVGGYVESIQQQRGGDGRVRVLEPGDIVKQGALLAKLRTTDYDARVHQSLGMKEEAGSAVRQFQAQSEQTEAQLIQAANDWQRAEVLFDAGAMTKPDYDAAQARYAMLKAGAEAARAAIFAQKARVTQANAGLKTAEVSLEDTELRSPLDAVVLSRTVEVGTLATSGMTGFSLAKINLVKAVFGVPDTDLTDLRLGAHLPVTTDALARECFEGTITSIAPIADSNTRTYSIQLTIDNPQLRLKPGMICSITLSHGKTRLPVGLKVPLTALVRAGTGNGNFAVYRVAQQNGASQVHLQRIQMGEVQGNQAVIIGGLAANDRIVESGGSQLFDGATISTIQ